MPLPAFVPMVGSGFDALAGQGQFWAGFNQRQDAENIRRAQMADEASNNWFANLARMQQEENARRDRLDQAQQEADRRLLADTSENAWRRQAHQEQSREARRQFDVQDRRANEEFQWKKDSEQRSISKEQEYVDDLGNTLAPHADEVGKAHDESGQAFTEATTALKLAQARWSSKLPNGQWDTKSERYVKKLGNMVVPWTPEEQKVADEASADIAAKQADYANAARDYKDSAGAWQELLRTTSPHQLFPFKDENGNWGLRSPVTKKNYFAAKKAESQGPAAEVAWQGPWAPTTGGGWERPAISTAATTPPTSVPFPPPAAAAPSADSDVAGFVPNPQPGLVRSALAVGANETLAPYRGLKYMFTAPPPISPSGLGREIVGDPSRFMPSAPPVPSGRVRVVSPDGKTGTIPREQLELALAKGFKMLTGVTGDV